MSAKRKARGNISKNSKQIKVGRSENGTKYRKTKMIKAPRMWTHYGGLNHQTLLSIESSNSLRTESAVRMSFLSKQWEDVESSVPVLDFDEGNIHHTLDKNTRNCGFRKLRFRHLCFVHFHRAFVINVMCYAEQPQILGNYTLHWCEGDRSQCYVSRIF
ncbi:hypothetical protein ACFX1X_046184 [Malus domestica]